MLYRMHLSLVGKKIHSIEMHSKIPYCPGIISIFKFKFILFISFIKKCVLEGQYSRRNIISNISYKNYSFSSTFNNVNESLQLNTCYNYFKVIGTLSVPVNQILTFQCSKDALIKAVAILKVI